MMLQFRAARLLRALGLLGLVLLMPSLSACTSPANSSSMVPDAMAIANHQPASVSVQVSGGCNPCEAGTARVSNEAYTEALTNAIKKSNVFAQVLGTNAADYALTIQIFHFDTPAVGFSMTSTVEAGWTLMNTVKKTVVWQESIATPFTASVGDAVIGAERVRLTWEGSVRENIKKGLEKISRVNLETGQVAPAPIAAPAPTPVAEMQPVAAQPASPAAPTPPVQLAPAPIAPTPPPVPVVAPAAPLAAVEVPPPVPVAAVPSPPPVPDALPPRVVAAQPASVSRQAQLDAHQQAKFMVFLTKPLPRVFAISTNGHSASVWGQLTDGQGHSVDLRQRALDGCRQAAAQDCVLYAIDDTVLSTGADVSLE